MFNINYTKVKFTISFNESCEVNVNKNSALRGILGHGLMDCNCIINEEKRNCSECYYNNRCIAANILNVKFNRFGEAMDKNGIAPIIINCSNKATNFEVDDKLDFTVTIFSDAIILMPYIFYAYQFAGVTRGLKGGKFSVKSVELITGEKIFDGKKLYKDNIKALKLEDYIRYRKVTLKNIEEIKFCTPLRYKKEGRLSKGISSEDFINLLIRRIESLNRLEGNEIESLKYDKVFDLKPINIKWKEQERFSNRQKQGMSLGGLIGSIALDNVQEEYVDLIIAGELLHIGKSTSLGLGQYIIK